MQTECRPSVDYPCLSCEDAAEEHDVHPFFDLPSWQDGYGRGYEEGRLDGEHLAEKALRADLLFRLATMADDLRLGLRHDLETPLEVLHQVARLVEKRLGDACPRRHP
jgi:hypothetical protein